MSYKTERFFVGIYHKLAGQLLPHIPVPTPQVVEGEVALEKLAEHLIDKGIERPVIFTDPLFSTLPAFQHLIAALDATSLDYRLFNAIKPDPTYRVIEQGIEVCNQHQYDCAIAIGGGSSIDATKMINACAKHGINPRTVTHGLLSLFQLRHKGAYFVAIPTTSGTGSEATTITVITDEKTNLKHGLGSYAIVPDVAVFDPRLTQGLPPPITAMTGMDALTHAIESFLSIYATQSTDKANLETIKTIFEYLPRAYKNGEDDLEARSKMALASFEAGKAFSRTLLGWAHGISHQLGAYYKVPHGLGCAKALPHIVEFLIPTSAHRIALIADVLEIGDGTNQQKAQAVVDALFDLCTQLDIEAQFEMLEEQHVKDIARNMVKKGNLGYPSPRNFDSYEHLEQFLLARKNSLRPYNIR
ncbi:iron-containing alcohol dehydrogenase [Vibrio sp. SCSIO 43136]|uniref:iron-containing alcohol dehydrogenase n=1 Tax=Vibrio sp. SCSIO 43136 TaxID=2819101 RepID=UPI0020761232|nr:iron-containing alcohol dehydrogenase [Vibrio sp. SCSIO 43136]USD66422.1 iron-containing alcohol dehydrogenase [Vibrio sp. SCSIO 43136]